MRSFISALVLAAFVAVGQAQVNEVLVTSRTDSLVKEGAPGGLALDTVEVRVKVNNLYYFPATKTYETYVTGDTAGGVARTVTQLDSSEAFNMALYCYVDSVDNTGLLGVLRRIQVDWAPRLQDTGIGDGDVTYNWTFLEDSVTVNQRIPFRIPGPVSEFVVRFRTTATDSGRQSRGAQQTIGFRLDGLTWRDPVEIPRGSTVSVVQPSSRH